MPEGHAIKGERFPQEFRKRGKRLPHKLSGQLLGPLGPAQFTPSSPLTSGNRQTAAKTTLTRVGRNCGCLRLFISCDSQKGVLLHECDLRVLIVSLLAQTL